MKTTPKNTPMLRASLAAALSLIVQLLVLVSAHATDRTWTGAGDQTWSDPNDWGGTAPLGGDNLFFDGSAGLAPNNDLAVGTIFTNLTFNAGAGAFTLSGNQLALGAAGGITNFSPNVETITLTIDPTRPGNHVINAAVGPIVITGAIPSDNANSRLIKEGTNSLTLNPSVDNPWLGITINRGTVYLSRTPSSAGTTVANDTVVNTNGVLIIPRGVKNDQIWFGAEICVDGGLFQLQNTNEAVLMIQGMNSYGGIIENGLAGTTNQLQTATYLNRCAIYNGTIRDGAAGVLSYSQNSGFGAGQYQVFNGTNTYSGTTAIANNAGAGTAGIIMNGGHIGGGAYTISGGPSDATRRAFLGGSGFLSVVTINVNANGFISPGGYVTNVVYGGAFLGTDPAGYSNSTATLTFSNNVSLNTANSSLDLELNGNTAGSGYDQVVIAGTGVFSNKSGNLNLTLGYTPADGDQFTIVKVTGTNPTNNVGVFSSFNGIPTDLSQGAIIVDSATGRSFKISYRAEGSTFDAGAGNGNDIMLQAVSPVITKTLTWRGNGTSNPWDTSTADWFNGTSLDTYVDSSAVTFDDTGSNSVPVNLTGNFNPAQINFNATNDYVLGGSGNLTGVVLINKTNTGTVSVTTDNNNIGTTLIRQGTLQMGTNSTSGTLSGSISLLTTNSTLAFNRSDDLTFGLTMAGVGNFVHNGSGQLTIVTAVPFAGATTNTGGTLQFGNGGAVGSIGGVVGIGAGKTLNYIFTGSDVSILNGLSGSGTVNWESDGGNRLLDIATSAGSPNFTGVGNVVGITRLHTLGTSVGFPLGKGSTVNISDGGQVWIDGSATPITTTFNIAGSGSIADSVPLGALRVFGVTLNGTAINLQANARIGGSIAASTILCPITGPFQLEILGTFPTSFGLNMGPTNGVHTYTSTLITAGIVKALNSNAISTGPLTMDTPGTLQLNGFNLSVANLSSVNTGTVPGGTGPFVVNNSTTVASVLTVGSDNTSTEYDGYFTDGSSMSLGLTKIGSGILTVTGVNSNTGPVTVSGGTLALSGAGSFGKAAQIIASNGGIFDLSGVGGTLTLNSGQTVGGNGTVNGSVVAPAGSTVAPGFPLGTLTVSGSTTINGTYRASLNRTNSPSTSSKLTSSGGVTISGATLSVTNVGPRLQVGDFFQLFPSATAGFITFAPQVNDVANNAVYTWNNTVSTDGRVTVAGVTDLVNPSPTNIIVGVTNGTSLTLSWPTDHTGWTLQSQTNPPSQGLGTNWFNVTGSAATNRIVIPINPTNNVFFRMKF